MQQTENPYRCVGLKKGSGNYCGNDRVLRYMQMQISNKHWTIGIMNRDGENGIKEKKNSRKEWKKKHWM